MEYRKRLTGEVFTYLELLQAVTNTYIPAMPTEAYMDALGYDIVQEVVPEQVQYVEQIRAGIEQGEGGKWYQAWRAVPWPQALIDEDIARQAAQVLIEKKALMVKIDDAVAARIERSTRFSMEYEQREAAAEAFKNNAYKGDPGEWVTRFATNAGMNNTAAADLILQQANGLRAALKELGSLRMDKYLVQQAESLAEAQALAQDTLNKVQAVVIP